MSLTGNTMNFSTDNDPAIKEFNTTKLLKNARKQARRPELQGFLHLRRGQPPL